MLPHESELSSRSLPKDDGDGVQQESEEEGHQRDNIIIQALNSFRSSSVENSSTSLNSTSAFYSTKECALCLGRYKEGDEICWSKNENCVHAFHLNCMVAWLMKNDKCPLCQNEYLLSEEV